MNKALEIIYKAYLEGSAICTDTRKIVPGCIFFALKGPAFNGNTFALQALNQGARFAVVDDASIIGDGVVQSDDVLTFLQQLATHHRNQLNIPVIGITGSNGKTTTKELVSSVLSKKFRTLFTIGNLNNHIGVPLTLLSLTREHEIAVVEMGANHQQEIALLCSIARPSHVLITNVGKAHLEGFGGFEGVMKGKGEMYAFARENNATVFLNADNPHLLQMLGNYNLVVRYGTSTDADVTGELLHDDAFVTCRWKTATGNWQTIRTQITGGYNLENILSAVTIGVHFEVPQEQISNAIQEYVPDNQRSQVIQIRNNVVVMDAYNANPTSMEAALKNFREHYKEPSAVFIGEMLELGDTAPEEHKQIGDLLATNGFTDVVLVGKQFSAVKVPNSRYFETAEEAREYIRSKKYSGFNILVKGSRGSKMEIAAEGLRS